MSFLQYGDMRVPAVPDGGDILSGLHSTKGLFRGTCISTKEWVNLGYLQILDKSKI